MDYRVVFRETFIGDLGHIVRGVAQHNRSAARRLGERIVSLSESLAFFPERHPRVRERPELRRFVVARHFKVFYRVRPREKVVEILRCWDGRQGRNPEINRPDR